MLGSTSTRQLHLRFTRGFWDAESWGRLPHDGFKSGGSGVELWAIIEAGSQKEAFDQWKTLANSLSGLFCASINFIESSRTTYPVKSFQPKSTEEGLPIFGGDETKNNKLYLLRASLANEPICTENLTPLLKLLPTRGKSGISSLLDGHKVFDSMWHSLSIDVTTHCDFNTQTCKYDMDAEVDMVIHVPYTLARNEHPIPRPTPNSELRCDLTKPYDIYQCFPLPESNSLSFEVSEIFGKPIRGSNLISNNPSKVCVDIGDNHENNSWEALLKVNGSHFGTDDNCFDLENKDDYDIYISSSNTNEIGRHSEKEEDVPLYVSRSLTGYGQDRGGLRTVFTNPTNDTIRAVYFESLPWFMRLYLSTMKLESDAAGAGLDLHDVITSVHYVTAIDHKRPTHLEYTIEIPAGTSLAITCQFDKALLQFAEYPPDANHGFEIESAVVTILKPWSYQIRTSTLLLSLSTPDFSMPYNVIIITSTVLGLIYGSLYNLLVKKLVTIEEADEIASQVGLKSLITRLKKKFI